MNGSAPAATTEADVSETMLTEIIGRFRASDPGLFFVAPRVMRRILRHELEISSPWVRLPHRKSYVIDRDRLLWLVALDELGIEHAADLPHKVVLIARPDDTRLGEFTSEQLLRYLWRLAFHARLDAVLLDVIHPDRLPMATLRHRIDDLGQAEYDEVRSVLKQEAMLLQPGDAYRVYAEFLAVFHELRLFAPDMLPLYFPSLPGSEPILRVTTADVDPELWLERTRPHGFDAPPAVPVPPEPDGLLETGVDPSWETAPAAPSAWKYRSLIARAEAAAQRGNLVRSALLRQRALSAAPRESRPSALQELQQIIDQLAERLQRALLLSDADLAAWKSMLARLLPPAVNGLWNANARLLYDVQKVCIDSERESYRVNVGRWLSSAFHAELREPLPQLRTVLLAKHLRTAARRVSVVQIDSAHRRVLHDLLHHAAQQADWLLRHRLQPILETGLSAIGVNAPTVVERVAFHQLTAGLLDVVVDRGYLTLGHVRDAFSRSPLKLPDVVEIGEFVSGDLLLRADKRLASDLVGVYHRGPLYLRALQRMTSLAFGTRSGRVFTLYVGLPFGGAFIILKGLHHLVEEIVHFLPHGPAHGPSHAGTAEMSAIGSHGDGVPDGPAAEADQKDKPGQDGQTDTTGSPSRSDTPQGDAAPPQVLDGSVAPKQVAQDGAVNEQAIEEDAPSADTTANGTTTLDAVPGSSTTAESSAHTASPLTGQAPASPLTHTASTRVADTHQTHASVVQIYSHEAMLLLGCVLFLCLHWPLFRSFVVQGSQLLWQTTRLLLVHVPRWLLKFPPIAAFLRSVPMLLIRRYLLSPLLVTLVLWQFFPAFGWYPAPNRTGALIILVLSGLLLNSRLGRDGEELFWEYLGHTWYRIRVHLIIGAFNFIVDCFRQIMDLVDRVLYTVDEWLRFRSGESSLSLAIKAVLSPIWGFINGVLRFVLTLLVEPQVNPIKHFPVVTVSHKLILPTVVPLTGVLEAFFDKYTAGLLATGVVTCIPGVFGFLAWELKENWRLYAANRPRRLKPVLIGHHGETLPRMLRPGFHSGTIPKLFAKRRRAARKTGPAGQRAVRAKFAEKLHHEVEALSRFLDRELIALLQESKRLGPEPISLGPITVSTNRIEAQLVHAGWPEEPCELHFSEQSGWLMASIPEPGWTRRLTFDQKTVLSTALAGLYQLGAVQLVREQIEAQLGTSPLPFDIADTGLVVWPSRTYDSEVTYSLHDRPLLTPRPRSVARAAGLEPSAAAEWLFTEHPVDWDRWRTFWIAEAEDLACPGALLPRVAVLRNS
jgi:hypothetical protein